MEQVNLPSKHASPSAVPRFAKNLAGRDFAVGDIHGCFTEMQRGLDLIGFDVAVDRLFSVGDLVDRGPESNHVLRWLDRPWFHAICGNHDFLAWRSALGRPYTRVDQLQHGGAWLQRESAPEQRLIGDRLAALPIAIEIETGAGLVGLVHAACPFDDWSEMDSLPSLDDSITGRCLWSIDRYKQGDEGRVKNVRAVVHGHMTTKTMEILGNSYFIDTGGWRAGGHFTFLELESLEAHRGVTNTTPVPSKRNR